MDRATLRFGIATAAAVASIAAASSAAAGQPCQPSGSKTLAGDSYARVYAKGGKAYACVRSSGKTFKLTGASPSADQFALAGKWVAFSSGSGHSVVNVVHIPDRAVPSQFPFDTNDHVDKVVVKNDGAAAWAATPQPAGSGSTYVQGTDRSNHPPDQLSDDTKDVVGSSLHSLAGHAIDWSYSDGSSGTAALF